MNAISNSTADFNWLTEHSLELSREYRGKWIAIHNGRVISIGDTAVEVDKKAREEFPDGGFLLWAVDAETDVIYACL